jgi:hypothetical protein
MLKHQLESWTLDILDRVASGSPVEDSRVELKREWPTAVEAARRIAGHANAAQGEPILWLIGVDEKAHSVVGASFNELANWYPAIESQFDDVAPSLQELAVPYGGLTVVALLFETDRAPFVVKNPAGGHIDWEVPWREGTKTRSVRRVNLLRLLSGLTPLPDVELLEANLTVRPSDTKPDILRWKLEFTLYISPRASERVVIPFHRCKVEVRLVDAAASITLGGFDLTRVRKFQMPTFQPIASERPPGPASYVPSEAVIDHPSRFIALATAHTERLRPLTGEAVASLLLLPAGAKTGVSIIARIHPINKGQESAAWALAKNGPAQVRP